MHYFFDRVFFPTANRLSALRQRLKARDDIAAQVVARAAYDSHLRGDDVPKLVTEVSEATSEGIQIYTSQLSDLKITIDW